MGFIFPLHPDDIEQLLKIRRYLIGFRKTNGWTRGELSKMINENDEDRVRALEASSEWGWRFSRLQAWPEPFGLRLDARLWMLGDLAHWNMEIHGSPDVAPLYSLSQQDSGDWQMWQRAYLTAALRKARQVQGISGPQMGERMGLSPSAVNSWEREADQVTLSKVLHYARLLGGFVKLELVEK